MNFVLYPLAAVGAAAVALVATCAAVTRQERRLDDIDIHLRAIAATWPPVLADECVIDWDKFDKWLETL